MGRCEVDRRVTGETDRGMALDLEGAQQLAISIQVWVTEDGGWFVTDADWAGCERRATTSRTRIRGT